MSEHEYRRRPHRSTGVVAEEMTSDMVAAPEYGGPPKVDGPEDPAGYQKVIQYVPRNSLHGVKQYIEARGVDNVTRDEWMILCKLQTTRHGMLGVLKYAKEIGLRTHIHTDPIKASVHKEEDPTPEEADKEV